MCSREECEIVKEVKMDMCRACRDGGIGVVVFKKQAEGKGGVQRFWFVGTGK